MTKFKVILFLLITALSIEGIIAQPHLMRFADVSSDDIVFTYENDLWLVPIDGGTAKRITRADGTEIYAKLSPDGSMIAFTANYDGGNDIYVRQTEGSEPKRLTYHPASDLMLDWFPDGQHILFRSIRDYPTRNYQIYKVSIDGGMPVKMPVDQAGLASLSPDGNSVAYNRLSREFRTWKRYEGGTAQDVWMGSFEDRNYIKITEFEGTDNFPMWHGNSIYFTSDREDGTLNIFKYDISSKSFTRMTNYNDYDVKYPSVGEDHIVYQYAEELYLLDLASGLSEKVNIEIPSEHLPTREMTIDAADYTWGFGLSPCGAKAVMDIRGEIILIPTDDGLIRNLTKSSGSRDKNPVWSPDGKQIAFLSDKTGEEELYLVEPSGGEPRRLTEGGLGFRMQPVWSPDSKYLLFSDKFMRLNLVDAASGGISEIDKSDYDDAWERWGIQDYVFSPDGRWIAYTKMEQSFYESIFLYSMDQGKSYRVTGETTQDWIPSFSPDGKYLYFLSNRTYNPIMGFVDQNHIFLDMTKAYIVLLEEDEPSPFSSDLNSDPENEEAKADEGVNVSTEDFEKRTIGVPMQAGNLFRLEAVDDGFHYLKKTSNEFLKYQTVTDANGSTNLDLYHFNIKNNSNTKLISGISQYHLSADGKKLIYKSRDKFGVVDALKPANVGDGRINLSEVKITIDPSEEFMQMFNEAWRIQRDWFYDPDMHGVDWEKVGGKYRKFVPYCDTRENLNYLIGEMIAELNAGHTYIYGGDSESYERVPVGMLGVDFSNENDSPYPRIERIVPGDNFSSSAYSPFYMPGSPVKEGDYIIAIDGVELQKGENIYKLLKDKRSETVEVTYNSSPSSEGAKTYYVETARSEYTLRYRDWVKKNRQYVVDETDDEVAYLHLPGMMQNGLIELAKEYFPNYYKKGIIIDARYNGGGFTSKQIVDRLERKRNTMMQPREGMPTPIPERAFHGHLVLIINANTGSDGELFSEAWRYRDFGPIIGERTWGGAVGIEPHQNLIDGAACTPPQFGEYSIDGRWVIEGRGVEPDIEVVNMPKDALDGKDAQLDKAIEVILEKIRTEPKKWAPLPQYPDKSKPTIR